MGANYSEIQELLQQRADIQARLDLMPYDGNPEIKEVSGTKYLYIRIQVSKGRKPHVLAHKWFYDVLTLHNMSIKVGRMHHDIRILCRIVGVRST